jgi:adenylyltransferase/sulfurtransferase
MAKQLGTVGTVSFNRFMLKFTVEEYEFTVFPDGRAIIKGTNDTDKARTLYAKYIGH